MFDGVFASKCSISDHLFKEFHRRIHSTVVLLKMKSINSTFESFSFQWKYAKAHKAKLLNAIFPVYLFCHAILDD